jgi:hypothetical protein
MPPLSPMDFPYSYSLKLAACNSLCGNYGSDRHYCTAVALAERPAAIVSFQWQQPSLSLHKNDVTAASPALPAVNSAGIVQNLQQMQSQQQHLHHFGQSSCL